MKHFDCSVRVTEHSIRVHQLIHGFQPHSKKDNFGEISFFSPLFRCLYGLEVLPGK